MRVLHVIPSVALKQGGPSFVLRQIVTGLASAGVDVHVATTTDACAGEIASRTPAIESGVNYWYLPRQTGFYTFSWPLSSWLASNIGSYDLVHIHALFSFPSVAAAYWASRYRVPYIVRPLGTLNRWGFENRRPWLKYASFRCIEARILRGAAAVHYTTEEEQIEAERLPIRHRPVVIPNPYELPTFSRTGASLLSRFPVLGGKTAILFLSRIHRKKGLDLLLPAFRELHKRHPEAVLIIAGDGESALVAELRVQARELRIGNHVSWVGFLSGEEKLDALRTSAVFVLPSYSENFGVAVIEAMAAGLPVVVSDQVAIHNEVQHAGAGLVCSCSPKSVATALCRILDDPIDARRMAAKGAAFASEHYSIPAVTARLIDLYNSILGCQPELEAVLS
jgi:glycosyltransferase involved in cell wall biosynthesis